MSRAGFEPASTATNRETSQSPKPLQRPCVPRHAADSYATIIGSSHRNPKKLSATTDSSNARPNSCCKSANRFVGCNITNRCSCNSNYRFCRIPNKSCNWSFSLSGALTVCTILCKTANRKQNNKQKAQTKSLHNFLQN